MIGNHSDRGYSTNPERESERLKQSSSRLATRRHSRRLSSAETLRFENKHYLKSLPGDDPRSYVTRPLDESAGERRAGEVSFDAVKASDSLIIRTEYSTYSFLVIDPVERVGILTGGRLKKTMVRATLVGALDQEDARPVRDESRLRTGTQALFHLKSAQGVRRIITSTITDLFHERGPQRQ